MQKTSKLLPWHRQLIKSLFHYSASRVNIESAFRIKHPQMPHYLYKYRSFSKEHKQALEENVLWRSSAENFNDPYEGFVTFKPTEFIVENSNS